MIAFTFIIACNTASSDKNNIEKSTIKVDSKNDIGKKISDNKDNKVDSTDDNYATYFVVISDTGYDYKILHNNMVSLNRKLNIPIDTMRRYYNKSKNLIELPDDDSDEIYAGAYFPRRFPSGNLSLEYLSYYQKRSEEKTIALVTGIYQKECDADSALTTLKKTSQNAFMVKANIYVGCVH